LFWFFFCFVWGGGHRGIDLMEITIRSGIVMKCIWYNRMWQCLSFT